MLCSLPTSMLFSLTTELYKWKLRGQSFLVARSGTEDLPGLITVPVVPWQLQIDDAPKYAKEISLEYLLHCKSQNKEYISIYSRKFVYFSPFNLYSPLTQCCGQEPEKTNKNTFILSIISNFNEWWRVEVLTRHLVAEVY